MFPSISHETQQFNTAGRNALTYDMTSSCLAKLLDTFNDYIPENNKGIHNPFGVDVEGMTLPSNKEAQLVEVLCDSMLKRKFPEVSFSVLVYCDD